MDYTNIETLIMTGSLEIILVDANGELKDKRNIKNLIVTAGKNYIASRMKDTAGSPSHTIAPQMSHMAIAATTGAGGIGTLPNSPAVGDVNLGSAELARNALATAGGQVSANVVTYSATYAPGTGTGRITDAGIFNYGTYAASPSTNQFMLCRTVFLEVNKAAADTLTINWNVTVN